MRAEKAAPLPPGRTPRFIVAILGIGGLALLALGLWLLVPALRSTTWPSVQGVITGHRIESVYLNQAMNYQVGVDYLYTVERTRYTGHVFSHASTPLPTSYLSRDAAEAAYASDRSWRDWQTGQAVTVFYDPQHPEESVLQNGTSRLSLAVCLLGAGLLGVAAWEGRKLRRRMASTSGGGVSIRPG